MRAIVVGAGVQGLCLAFELQKRGWEVDVIEARNDIDQNASSWISPQIIRPQYADHIGFGLRIQAAHRAWKQIFSTLGRNYLSPRGVIAISCSEGDWADRTAQIMRSAHLDFGLVNKIQLQMMLPAMELEAARFGVLSDFGGYFESVALMQDLTNYLRAQGVRIHYEETALAVDAHNVKTSQAGKFTGDKVFVTSGQQDLLPGALPNLQQFRAYFLDIPLNSAQEIFWRFSPIWVDLGAAHPHLWGGYVANSRFLRLASGALTHQAEEPREIQEISAELLQIYRPLIPRLQEYAKGEIHSFDYQGFVSGAFEAVKINGVYSIVADSGHGFKFAALNAFDLVEGALEDRMAFASRKIAGAY